MIPFTPGPWSISDLQFSRPLAIEVSNERGVVMAKALFVKSVDQMKADARLIMFAPLMYGALHQWKCPGCGGAGTYQQNAKGRARDEARGRKPDPKFTPDPVACKVCGGDGLNPIASHIIKQIEGEQL